MLLTMQKKTVMMLAGVLALLTSTVALAAADSSSTMAQERQALTEVEGISVRGSDEQPKVLHIVPWKPPTLQRRAKPELRTDSVETVLEPINPEALRTHRHFRNTLDVLDSRGRSSNR